MVEVLREKEREKRRRTRTRVRTHVRLSVRVLLTLAPVSRQSDFFSQRKEEERNLELLVR